MPVPSTSGNILISDGTEWVSSNYAFEQGTWLPTIETGAGPGTGQVYQIRTGRWTRIARQVVHISGRVHLTTKGTFPAGHAYTIANLPFAVKALTGDRMGAISCSWWALPYQTSWVGFDPWPSSRHMALCVIQAPAGGISYVADTWLGNGSGFIFGGFYFTSDP